MSVTPHGAWWRPGGGAAFGGKADIAGVDSLVTQIDETTKRGPRLNLHGPLMAT